MMMANAYHRARHKIPWNTVRPTTVLPFLNEIKRPRGKKSQNPNHAPTKANKHPSFLMCLLFFISNPSISHFICVYRFISNKRFVFSHPAGEFSCAQIVICSTVLYLMMSSASTAQSFSFFTCRNS
jgi:hypothetical protein